MAVTPLQELEILLYPPPSAAVQGLWAAARHMPVFVQEQPPHRAPSYVKWQYERRRMRGVVAVASAVISLQKYFRSGLPRDAEPEYYEALDVANNEQLEKMACGQEVSLCLGHVQDHVILILNLKDEIGQNCFAICDCTSPAMKKKVDDLLKLLPSK